VLTAPLPLSSCFLSLQVGTTQPIITMETRDFDHVKEIVDRLKKEGFESTYLATPVESSVVAGSARPSPFTGH
jgi:hypothetical protein